MLVLLQILYLSPRTSPPTATPPPLLLPSYPCPQPKTTHTRTRARASFCQRHGKLYHPTWTRLAAHVPGEAQQETGAPASRNTVIFLQDCVNWPAGGTVLVTTSHVKDTRDYTFNEEATIAADDDTSVQCISVDGGTYGQVTLATPLQYYHHAGKREYQSEVALLSRNVKVQGNDKSESVRNIVGCLYSCSPACYFHYA